MPKNKRKPSKKRLTNKEKSHALITVKEPFVGKKMLVGFARFALSGFALALILLIFQKPNEKVAKDQSVLGLKSGSVFKRELAEKNPRLVFPDITAASAVVVSTKGNKFLYSKNADVKLPPASTTKILTALLAIKEFDLGEVVVVPEFCTKVEGSRMGLVAGEKINVESLLYGLLVASAGDAACTLSTYKFASSNFVAKMNLLADKIGLANTSFVNPSGLDGEEENLSTARELYLMTKEALKDGVFRKIVGTKDTILYSADGSLSHYIKSTNELLFEIPGSLGVKTGTTPKAKEVLVYAYKRKDDEIIIVVMGSTNRFEDTKKLLNFTLTNYDYLFN